MNRIISLAARGAVPVLLILAAAGCDKKPPIFVPNQKPTVRMTSAPVSSLKSDSVYYAYRINWVGYDPDGRVDHFLYAIDPASVDVVDSSWVSSTRNEEFLLFRSRTPDRIAEGSTSTATELHVFALRAVDNSGDMSPVISRAFYSWTAAPEVHVTDPLFSNINAPIVPPSVRIQWQGIDEDGVFTQKPIKYKFRLFPAGPKPTDFPFPVNEANFIDFLRVQLPDGRTGADSLRKGYAPLFAGWDSSSAETTEVQYTDLVAEKTYMFVITGFDEAGAYDPVFSLNKNMVRLNVTFANNSTPIITMFNDFFNYTYRTGGPIRDEQRAVPLEIPAGQAVTFNWFMTPSPGAQPKRYRWVMDLVDLDDETPRPNEERDWQYWSQWGLSTTSATVGPFPGGETHFFYIAAEDNNNLTSLGIIKILVVQATLDRDLLIVDDTRFTPDDAQAGGGVRPPSGIWPTAAELDTFLYAVGGRPWNSYPDGTLSTPGIFAGYKYDTLGTRGMRDPIVPLSTLGKYAHVIWMTDQDGAGNNASQFDRVRPITSLREMNKRNRSNTLATYMRLGGRAWLLGGGIAKASLIEWENRQGASTNFTARDLELVPGRMMYDFPHWQTEVTAGASGSVARVGGRLAVDPVNQPGVFRVDPPGRGWVGQPNYSLLPPVLERKGVSSTTPPDPLPPLRGSQPGTFYQNSFWDESLFAPNFIREDINGPAPGGVESTLDTLYHYFTTSGGGGGATMTYYHGLETGAPVMFSGFPLWFPKRDQVIQLTDFVLHDVWGLVRQSVPREPSFVRPRAPVSARTAPGVRKPTAVAAGASAATTPRPATLAPAPRGAPLRSEN